MLYSPSLKDPALLRRLTVGKSRWRLLETLVEAVRAEIGREVHQHQLLIGPRGSGKTHLLTLVVERMTSDPELRAHVLPVQLPEEVVVRQPADLFIRILERLENRLVSDDLGAGRARALAECRDSRHRLRSENDEERALILAHGALEEIAEMLQRLLLVVVENLDSVLYTGYSRKNVAPAKWSLRRALMESRGLMMLAAAPVFFDEIADGSAPFYEFFRIHELAELSTDEMLELIHRRLEVELAHEHFAEPMRRRLRELLTRFDRRAAGLRGILLMAGGRPRFAHLLFDLLLEASSGPVAEMWERFLDTQTPYFQSRLDPRIVPQAELEVLEILATADGPLLFGEITARTRGATPNSVSNYLKRLRQRGLVRQLGRRQEVHFDVAEPLFRRWRQFRLGQPAPGELELLEATHALFEPRAEREEPGLPSERLRQDPVQEARSDREVEIPESLSIGDPRQATEEIHRRQAESEQRRKELEEVREAAAVRRAQRWLTEISDATFYRFVELASHVDEVGPRRGLIRVCVTLLSDPAQLLERLALFERLLPPERAELLQPIRLAAEILAGRRDRELPGEPEEMQRLIAELLENAAERKTSPRGRADLANELLRSLTEHPTSRALDALWALRVEQEHQQAKRPIAIVEVDKVMGLCAREADDWVRRAIILADLTSEPVHELAYLLTKMTRGRALWLELKDVLFAKVAPNHERSIAICLEWFHDDHHIDWLAARVQREDDFLGAAARRALFLLQPERSPDLVNDGLWKSYMLAPRWWLLPHLNAGSEEAVRLITEKALKNKGVDDVVWQLAGFENRFASEALDRILDATEKQLSEVLESQKDDKRDLWTGFLRALANIRGPVPIERIRARCGTELESRLVSWLCDVFDEDLGWNFGAKAAHQILKLIGGEGLTCVVNHYLHECAQEDMLHEVIDLAIPQPDEETIGLLFDVALRDKVEDADWPHVQVEAIGALLSIGRPSLALRGVMKWGRKLRNSVANLFLEQPIELEDASFIFEALNNPAGPDPNAAICLGLCRRQDQVPRLHAILETSPKQPELTLACLLALWWIGDRSHPTVQAFIENLQVPENEYVSWQALLDIGTPEALEALKGRLPGLKSDQLDSSHNAVLIAANLLRIEQTRREVAEYLWKELEKSRILFITHGDLDAFVELDRQDVRDWICDGAFGIAFYWRVYGAQPGAIRALARWDTSRAFDAAFLLLAPSDSNRELAPSLLLEIAPDRAVRVLREAVETEDSVLMLAAVGEALHLAGKTSALLAWLEDASPQVREAACVAVQVHPWTEDLYGALRNRLYDETWGVRLAANQAMDRLWHAREHDRLVEAILAESERARRWCLLDVALEGGHPGLTGDYRDQPWVAKLFEQLPLAMRQRAVERLKKRRKDLRDELKKQKRAE